MNLDHRNELNILEQSQAEERARARIRWRTMAHEDMTVEHEVMKAKHLGERRALKERYAPKPEPKEAKKPTNKKIRAITLTDNEHKALRVAAKRDSRTMSAEIATLVKWRIKMLREKPELSIDELIAAVDQQS